MGNVMTDIEKKINGCDMCRGITKWVQFLDGNHPEVEFKYCPTCGRELVGATKVTVKKKTNKEREIEAIAEVIEMGSCYFGADPAYFDLPDAHNIELAQARALYEAGYRKVK